MSYVKRDLLVHYDEASGQYSFFAVDSADAAPLRAAAGGRLVADASFFGDGGSAHAEQSLGRLVLTLLDRGYEAAPVANPAPAAVQPGAQEYARFIDLQSRAMTEYSSELLAEAEAMLQTAATLGHADASDTMKDWPTVKMVSMKLIARGPQ